MMAPKKNLFFQKFIFQVQCQWMYPESPEAEASQPRLICFIQTAWAKIPMAQPKKQWCEGKAMKRRKKITPLKTNMALENHHF